jgi:adenosine kinase
LNVAFYVNHVSETYGGTGANIAYNLSLLGDRSVLLGSAGGDFAPFRTWLQKHNVDTKFVSIKQTARTSAVYLMTDKLNNQISAYYPGTAAAYRKLPSLGNHQIDFGISSPSKLEDTWRMATFFKQAKIPFAFDPGQRITALAKQHILKALTGATMLFTNEYENAILRKKTGLSVRGLLQRVGIVVTTMGVKGSRIQTAKQSIHVKASKPKVVLDPTGAGDAYRAGFLYGYLNQLDLRTCAEIGSVTSTFTIEHYGTQVHTFTKRDVQVRLKANYQKRIVLP